MSQLTNEIDPQKIHSVHLVAICGVAMTALAGMFKQRGFAVTGSDENIYPPMSLIIDRLGIPVMAGYRAENIAHRPDLVIIGNKVTRDNPEVVAVLASGIPYTSLPAALGSLFLADRRSLVVAGTHGKTTSTAMLAWVLERAGRDPSMLVGGDSLDFGGNFKLGNGEFFVIEGDEYDSAFFDKGPKFLHYRPSAVLLNAVEFDHADIYTDLDAVKASFRKLVALLPVAAPLIVCADFPHALDVTSSREVCTFGIDAGEWRVGELADDGERTSFEVVRGDQRFGTIRLRQPGAINARNALGVYLIARSSGLAHDEIVPGLESFRGVARRQEVVANAGEITLLDDFAHHPTAVAGTLDALRGRYRGRRILALFEPRSNTSRRRVFQSDYVRAFGSADRVLIGGVYQKSTDAVVGEDLFSPEQLADDLRRSGVDAVAIGTADEIASEVIRNARRGDVVVTMSNGDFGGLRGQLADWLTQANGATPV